MSPYSDTMCSVNEKIAKALSLHLTEEEVEELRKSNLEEVKILTVEKILTANKRDINPKFKLAYKDLSNGIYNDNILDLLFLMHSGDEEDEMYSIIVEIKESQLKIMLKEAFKTIDGFMDIVLDSMR